MIGGENNLHFKLVNLDRGGLNNPLGAEGQKLNSNTMLYFEIEPEKFIEIGNIGNIKNLWKGKHLEINYNGEIKSIPILHIKLYYESTQHTPNTTNN